MGVPGLRPPWGLPRPPAGLGALLLGRETCFGGLLPTPPSRLGNVKTTLAKNTCVGGGKLTFPPLSSFLETVATVKYSKTEAGLERGEAPLERQKEPGPPCPLLLPPAIWPYGGVGGGWGLQVLRIMASCDARARQTPPPNILCPNPTIVPLSKMTPEGTCPRSHSQLVRALQKSTGLL